MIIAPPTVVCLVRPLAVSYGSSIESCEALATAGAALGVLMLVMPQFFVPLVSTTPMTVGFIVDVYLILVNGI